MTDQHPISIGNTFCSVPQLLKCLSSSASSYLIRQALRVHLRDFELFVAADGEEMATLVDRVGKDLPCPHVLLLDLNLPRVDGPHLFEHVRSHPFCSQTPVIVVTSSNAPRDHRWTSQYRVSHYFHKPSDYKEFLQLGAVVRSLVEYPD